MYDYDADAVMKRLGLGFVAIPMEGAIESLNVAMAAGVIAYEAFRQRRSVGADMV